MINKKQKMGKLECLQTEGSYRQYPECGSEVMEVQIVAGRNFELNMDKREKRTAKVTIVICNQMRKH